MTETVCGCYCHVNPDASCTIDNGMGVPGVAYCGPHLSGPLCLLSHGVDAKDHPRYREVEVGHLCRRHRAGLDDLLLEIELLIVDLGRIREDGSGPKQDQARKEHRKLDIVVPVPVNLDWVQMMDPRTGPDDHGIPQLLDIYCSQLTCLLPARHLVMSRLDILRRHHDQIAAADWVGRYIEDMTGLRQALRAAVSDREYRPIGRCREIPEGMERACGGVLLAQNGTGHVRCRLCKSTWRTPQELARLSLALEREL